MFPQLRKWFHSLAGMQPDAANTRRANALPTHNRSAAKHVSKPANVPVLRTAVDADEFELTLNGKTGALGPGKNVLSSSRLYCIDTGTHENLRIIDGPGDNEDRGIDPYNTGTFERPINRDKRFLE